MRKFQRSTARWRITELSSGLTGMAQPASTSRPSASQGAKYTFLLFTLSTFLRFGLGFRRRRRGRRHRLRRRRFRPQRRERFEFLLVFLGDLHGVVGRIDD